MCIMYYYHLNRGILLIITGFNNGQALSFPPPAVHNCFIRSCFKMSIDVLMP